MRLTRSELIALSLWLPSLASAMQVTPNSPCSTECIDNTSDNSGNDIVCSNSDYDKTFVGQKFKSCVNCLQRSAYSSSAENDQAWFLYNLRYALDWCLWSSANATTIGGPCLIAQACGDLSTSLKYGILNPSNVSTYDYCAVNGGSFLNSNADQCTSCLMSTGGESYLSNFVVALQAGCEQRPGLGMLIGLNDTVFSSTQVAITTVSAAASLSVNSSSGLSTGAKVGIVVGGLIAVLILSGISVICWKKKQRRTILRLKSDYDPKFGSPDITSPNPGAFVDPTYQPSSASKSFSKMEYSESTENLTSYTPESSSFTWSNRGKPSTLFDSSTVPPVHPAYILKPKQALYLPPSVVPPSTSDLTPTTHTAIQRKPSGSARSVWNPPLKETRATPVPQQPQPQPRSPAVQLRLFPGRQHVSNIESTQSVELWPGNM